MRTLVPVNICVMGCVRCMCMHVFVCGVACVWNVVCVLTEALPVSAISSRSTRGTFPPLRCMM